MSGRSQHFTLDRTEGVRAFLQIFPFERRHRRETPCAAAAELGKTFASRLDKAAKVGTIHANRVANKKSQLDKLLNSLAK